MGVGTSLSLFSIFVKARPNTAYINLYFESYIFFVLMSNVFFN
jgi:hypothetical protein